MKNLGYILLFLFSSILCIGQEHTYLIQFDEIPNNKTITNLESAGLSLVKKIFSDPIIYLYKNKNRSVDIDLERILNMPQVAHANKNRRAEWRTTTPNDPYFASLWHLNQTKAEQAWDFATSGVTSRGDTIVLAIYDSGYDLEHPDLLNNFWKNHEEIPNDGIDNDGNNYIDDYLGLNISSGADDHAKKVHGTEVVGIMGASGNNDRGVTGVTWNAKLLLMSKSAGGSFESDFIEAYNYTIDQRQKFNSTNGALGSFVVAVNLSVGISRAFPSEYPMWCAVYDKLGEHGILGICATDNDKFNVDEVGDIPTTCPSVYQIAVTSTDMNDERLTFAAFGPTHIDIAAPGDEILSTNVDNAYTFSSGTSVSTPQVTGAIGLMYMAASAELLDLVKSNPSAAARTMRELLLTSVDKVPNLDNMITSGGRLNLEKAVNAARNYTSADIPESLKLNKIYPSPASSVLIFELEIPTEKTTTISLYNIHKGHRVIHFTEQKELPIGSQTVTISNLNLASGGYIVVIEHDGESTMQKVMIINE